MAYSLIKHSSIPLDIRFLVLPELDFHRDPDPLQTTDFTYTRFLVPHLCQYQGVAVFMDSDMICLADIVELARLDMTGLALRVVQHNHHPVERIKKEGVPQTQYPRKNWSSLMMMNCARLGLWTKSFVERESGAVLHQFHGIPDDLIGSIPEGWNTLDRCRADTKLLHYTNGGPWLEQHRHHPDADIWTRYLNEYTAVRNVVQRHDNFPSWQAL